jgi:hypothetical protein
MVGLIDVGAQVFDEVACDLIQSRVGLAGHDVAAPRRKADHQGADWREVSRIVLHIDSEQEPDRAPGPFDNHLAH